MVKSKCFGTLGKYHLVFSFFFPTIFGLDKVQVPSKAWYLRWQRMLKKKKLMDYL